MCIILIQKLFTYLITVSSVKSDNFLPFSTWLPSLNELSFCFYLPLLLLFSNSVCLHRLMKDQSVDIVDVGFKEREMPMEREYQRVSISGEEKCGVRISNKRSVWKESFQFLFISLFFYVPTHFQVPFTDLVDAAKCVVKALLIREKYINRSMQTFCKTTAHALQDLGTKPVDLGVYDEVPETPVDDGKNAAETSQDYFLGFEFMDLLKGHRNWSCITRSANIKLYFVFCYFNIFIKESSWSLKSSCGWSRLAFHKKSSFIIYGWVSQTQLL